MADDIKTNISSATTPTEDNPKTVVLHRQLTDEEQAYRSLDDTVMRPMPESEVIWDAEPIRRPVPSAEPRWPRIRTGALVAAVAVVSFVAGGLTARMSSQVPVLFAHKDEPIEATASSIAVNARTSSSPVPCSKGKAAKAAAAAQEAASPAASPPMPSKTPAAAHAESGTSSVTARNIEPCSSGRLFPRKPTLSSLCSRTSPVFVMYEKDTVFSAIFQKWGAPSRSPLCPVSIRIKAYRRG